MNSLADLRGRAATALLTVADDDVSVLPDVVDAVTPPAFLLVWGEDWALPLVQCAHTVRLDVVCIAARMDPAPGIEQLETLVSLAVPALRQAALPEARVRGPGRFEIGGVAYLAARIELSVPLSIGGP